MPCVHDWHGPARLRVEKCTTMRIPCCWRVYACRSRLGRAAAVQPGAGRIAIIAVGRTARRRRLVQFQKQRVLVVRPTACGQAVVGLPLFFWRRANSNWISRTRRRRRIAFQVQSKQYETQYLTTGQQAPGRSTAEDMSASRVNWR